MVIAYALARPGRLPRLPPRHALVRPPDRRRRRRDRPHPRPLPLQRPARLRRPSVHRPRPRRPRYRDQRPRAGWPVLALLALAGLLRPEAWLFSVAYWLYLALDFRSLTAEARDRICGSGGDRHRPPDLARGALDARSSLWLAPLALAGPAPLGALRLRSPPAAPPTRSPAPRKRSTRSPARPARSTSSSTDPAASAKSAVAGHGRRRRRHRPRLRLPAPPLPRSAWSPPRSPSAPSPCSAAAGLAIIARYTMLGAAILAIFVAVALLGWRLLEATIPGAGAGRSSPALVALMFVLWLPNQWDLDSTVHRTSPTRARSSATSATSPTPAPSPSRSAARSPCPTTAPSPDSPSPSTSSRPQIVSASEEGVPRPRLLPRPGQPLRHPQLHPRPQRPDPLLARPCRTASSGSRPTTPGSSSSRC